MVIVMLVNDDDSFTNLHMKPRRRGKEEGEGEVVSLSFFQNRAPDDKSGA